MPFSKRQSTDSAGKIRFENKKFRRSVPASQINSVERTLKSEFIKRAVANGWVVKFELNKTTPMYGHAKLEIVSLELFSEYLHSKWSTASIFSGVQLWLDISQSGIGGDGIELLDANRDNVMLGDLGQAVWVDLGSFVGRNFRGIRGYTEFLQQWVFPYLLLRHGGNRARLVRVLLGSNMSIPTGMMLRLTPFSPRFYLLTFLQFTNQVTLLLSRLVIGKTKSAPRRFGNRWELWSLWLSRVIIPRDPLGRLKRQSIWSRYGSSGKLPRNSSSQRHEIVNDSIRKFKPRSILDLGSNDGKFILPFLKDDITITAIDTDDASISKFVETVWKKCDSRSEISHPRLGLVNAFEDINVKAELVLCLALTHHLALGQRNSFDWIAEKLAELSERYLLVEFMPEAERVPRAIRGVNVLSTGVGGKVKRYISRKINNHSAPEWYTLESFMASLSQYFLAVEVVAETNEGSRRVLIKAIK